MKTRAHWTLPISVAMLASSWSATAEAREPAPAEAREPAPLASRRWSILVGYFGEFLFHPGVIGGVEVRPVGNRRAELLVTGNVATYVHVRNHVGLMLYPEIGGRLRLGRRVGLEALGGVGYLHSFLAAPAYVVDDHGVVRRTANRGRPGVMPTGALGVSVATRHVAPFVRVQVFGQYPFNDAMLMHFALILGVRL